MKSGLRVAFALKSENSIGTSFHSASDFLSEMDSQKGKAWIGYRIDQGTHQVATLGAKLVILSTKRNDSQRQLRACKSRNAIAVQTCAIDQGFRCAWSRRRFDCELRTGITNSVDRSRRPNVDARAGRQFGVFFRYKSVIGNSRSGNQQSGNSGGVRLVIANLFRRQHPHTRNAVRQCSAMELLERRLLWFLDRHDHFSADFIR